MNLSLLKASDKPHYTDTQTQLQTEISINRITMGRLWSVSSALKPSQLLLGLHVCMCVGGVCVCAFELSDDMRESLTPSLTGHEANSALRNLRYCICVCELCVSVSNCGPAAQRNCKPSQRHCDPKVPFSSSFFYNCKTDLHFLLTWVVLNMFCKK